VPVPAKNVEERSERLAVRVVALAAALDACGVPDEVATRLLAKASAAALQALALEEIVRAPAVERVAETARLARPAAPAEREVPLAA
jgi:hypothetical protein